MSKIKNHYWEQLTLFNDEGYEAVYYQKTLSDVVELMQQYSVQTVLMDMFKLLESREVK